MYLLTRSTCTNPGTLTKQVVLYHNINLYIYESIQYFEGQNDNEVLLLEITFG